ncbi:class I SAM-dependent methyltransferase [Streptomyces pristinaespiralis]|uniref:NDP-hexose 3-C-methyltransferase n=2 Tax=Streptomyces pristinaespiralis TaxID=38300 RepID=D6X7X7_STRE2|nr:class I SAM-dependent methyltransferase [Streptomyces pristinaespiralis]ALC18545.1 methyltransferase [Streptomyces pristinaespiralis]ALC25420.1 methyltransferase [Streptomyces pristinaespiralis]EFH32245.1 NDP-hexose 3-C-methyltransferase [Streptomyces pristinaespiralis ATCC 25486]CBW45688.1 putative NDP-hexose 3-C-methyltransferase [Streptomyces pristinaespiralis]
MKIDECRICGNRALLPVLDLGSQALTGVFPKNREETVASVPLELVKCSQPDGCGLVQLLHTADFDLMYGDHYGYRSGLGEFMIRHLQDKVASLLKTVEVRPGDIVVDIGSNDSTLLRGYPSDPALRPQLVGIDPTGGKFRHLYPEGAELITEYFSRKVFAERFGSRRAKVVTSVAMFYDLPRPMEFMQDVHDILAEDGVWLMEQSYMPAMLEATAYDVVCHEHLEYYALSQIEWMAERVGLKVVRAELNDVYGGSLCAVLARKDSSVAVDEASVARVRAHETALALDTAAPYEAFAARTVRYREELLAFLDDSRRSGKLTLGYGASTKGNVILQYCGLSEKDLPVIGEVNPEKHGAFTPGTYIPIVSQEEARSRRPDQLLVLPWIYRDGFVERERAYVAGGGRLVFPLPVLDVVGGAR